MRDCLYGAGTNTKHGVQCRERAIEVAGEPQKNVACGACLVREAKRPEGAHRGTVPSSEKIAAPSLPGGVEGHAVTGGELTDSHEAIKSGAGRCPYSSIQRGGDVKG